MPSQLSFPDLILCKEELGANIGCTLHTKVYAVLQRLEVEPIVTIQDRWTVFGHSHLMKKIRTLK